MAIRFPASELPDDDPLIGSEFGKYRILARLGSGGMGVVYEARDETLQRLVALKLVSSLDPLAARRFLSEAQAAARLNHPNVVTIYEVSEFEAQHFLAMELVRGMSASEYLRTRGPMKWKVATRVLISACRGLAAAHRAGLIHRDLKPGNILLAKRGEIKLADFGLAKQVAETDRSLTTTGIVMGTPEYMSPEQCSSDVVTHQSDMYSLGASYFALLTGRPPFVCEQPIQTMFAHCSQSPPDPREFAPATPAACAEIVSCAMARQPHERFATATEMQSALEAVLKPGSTTDEQTMELRTGAKLNRPAGETRQATQPLEAIRRGQRTGVVIGVGLTLAAIVLGVVIARWSPAEPASRQTAERKTVSRPLRQQASQPGLFGRATTEGTVLTTVTSEDGAFVAVAMSPDGEYLAARVLGHQRGRLLIWDVTSVEPLMDRTGDEYGRASFLLADLIGTQMISFTRAGDWLVVGQLSGLNVDVEAWPVPPRAGVLPQTLSVEGRTVLSVAPGASSDQCVMSASVPGATAVHSVFASDWPHGSATFHWSDRLHRTSSHLLLAEPDGRHWLVSNGLDFVFRLDPSRPKMRSREVTTANIDCLCCSPLRDAPWVAVGSADTVELLDLSGEHKSRRLRVGADSQARITAMGSTADGKSVIVAVTTQGVSKLISVETANWARTKTIGTELPVVFSLAVSPTAPLLVTASGDGTLRLWKLAEWP